MKYWLTPLALASFLAMSMVANADSGTAIGALGGALVGSLAGPSKNRVENSLIGAAAGGVLGYAVSNGQARPAQVVTYAPPPSTTWVENGTTYMAPSQGERVCQEVELHAYIDGRRETTTGLKCQDEYGRWRLVDRAPSQTVVVGRPAPRYVMVEPVVNYYPVPVPVGGYGYGRYRHRDWHYR